MQHVLRFGLFLHVFEGYQSGFLGFALHWASTAVGASTPTNIPYHGVLAVHCAKTQNCDNRLSGANGVAASHPLSMREALGSIPSVSIFWNNFAALA